MGEQTFWILNYASHRLLGPFTPKETCVTLRVLEQMSSAEDFDIMHRNSSFNKREIVTNDFRKEERGGWSYEPEPRAASASDGMDLTGLRKL